MIVIDASAILAVLQRESGYENVASRMLADPDRRISPVSSLEVIMALSKKFADPARIAEAYLRQESIAVHPIDREQAEWASYAYLTYGKGRHPARLNLGDCFTYATAKTLNAPLLFVGSDFAKTDLRPA